MLKRRIDAAALPEPCRPNLGGLYMTSRAILLVLCVAALP
jgi:hypothetical protein